MLTAKIEKESITSEASHFVTRSYHPSTFCVLKRPAVDGVAVEVGWVYEDRDVRKDEHDA